MRFCVIYVSVRGWLQLIYGSVRGWLQLIYGSVRGWLELIYGSVRGWLELICVSWPYLRSSFFRLHLWRYVKRKRAMQRCNPPAIAYPPKVERVGLH